MPWKCFMVTLERQNPAVRDKQRPDISHTVLYRTPEGELLSYQELKIGAMYVHPDIGLVVKLPGYHGCNDWMIDRPGSNGFLWTRTGEPPEVTVVPSINCANDKAYHGFVTAGFVTDDISGKRFTDTGTQL